MERAHFNNGKGTSPLVSVIVPNYNHYDFLEQRIESILNQTFQDFELILLDDRSTDNSREMLERYRHHPKVAGVFYNDINSGSPFIQWKKGIDLAKGEYIWIAESDDYCEPSFLNTLIPYLQNNTNCAFVYCQCNDVDESGEKIEMRHIKPKHLDHIIPGEKYLRNHLLFLCTVYNASAAVFRKSAAEQIADDWIHVQGAGDYYFWSMLATIGDVAIVNLFLNNRRWHLSNVTTNANRTGVNLIGERKVYDYISHRVSIGLWRKLLANHIRRRTIMNGTFASEEIRDNLLELWGYGSKLEFLNKYIRKAYFTIINLTI